MKLGEAFKDKFEAVRKQLAVSTPAPPKPMMGVVVPISSPVVSVETRFIPSSLDEAQIVGDFLEWLFFQKKLHPDTKKEYLTALQQRYFMEKDGCGTD